MQIEKLQLNDRQSAIVDRVREANNYTIDHAEAVGYIIEKYGRHYNPQEAITDKAIQAMYNELTAVKLEYIGDTNRQQLKAIRQHLNLSQSEVSHLGRVMGQLVNASEVSGIENGSRKVVVRKTALKRLLTIYNSVLIERGIMQD